MLCFLRQHLIKVECNSTCSLVHGYTSGTKIGNLYESPIDAFVQTNEEMKFRHFMLDVFNSLHRKSTNPPYRNVARTTASVRYITIDASRQ